MKEILIKLVREVDEIPAVMSKIMSVRIDLEKQIHQGGDEETLRAAKAHLESTDRELEWLRSRHSTAVACINLVSALIDAGKADEAKAVLAALKGYQEQKNDSENVEKEKSKEEGLKIEMFTIKETSPGKNEGTVWAKAITDKGAEYKVCAKNGNAQTLLGATGKRMKIKYRLMGENKIFAVSAEIAG